jgi:hypothetical protein
MSHNRKELAVSLLQEAVFASRARQAVGAAIGTNPGTCGLGAETAVDLDLSPRGQELFDQIWTGETPPTQLEHIRTVLQEWVEIQDGFDRKRNHYLRDFRKSNGFDRRDYTAVQNAEFEKGLARVNDDAMRRIQQLAD